MQPPSEPPAILTVCGDAGGAKALAPVLQLLRRDARVTLTNAAYNQGRSVLDAEGLPFLSLPDDPADSAPFNRLFGHRPFAAVLTATSVNGINWEQAAIQRARQLKIPALAVLDFWSHYAPRFSRPGHLDALPDRIAVMDECARAGLAAAGIPPGRIVVTGQPAFDGLATERQQFSTAVRAAVRVRLGLDETERFILFASQPLRQLAEAGLPSPGFDERTVLAAILDALRPIARDPATPIALVIRPHPRESLNWFVPENAPGWRTFVATDGRTHELAQAADLVVGMNSVLLLEACYLGCAVLSLQPGLRNTDSLPTNADGISRAVYTEAEIAPTLAGLLLDSPALATQRARTAGLKSTSSAARQVAAELYLLLTSHANPGTPVP